jgi:PST family polysaccharide transporter
VAIDDPSEAAGAAPARAGADQHDELRHSSRRGVVINIGAQGLRLVLVFLNQILLARLLTPADFGLVAMVGPILAFSLLLADFGLTQSTIQRPNLTDDQLSFIFWMNFAASAALALLMLLSASAIAAFYSEPRVAPIAAVLSSLLLLSGLYAQHSALLNRRMRFGVLAAIDLLSYCGGAAVGLLLSWYGFGYWSLVVMAVTNHLLMVILSWGVTRWIPGRPRRVAEAGELVRQGGNMSGFNLSNYFTRNLDNVIIGRSGGAVELGYYDRAYRLLLLPIQQVNTPLAKVALPTLSRMIGDPDSYRRSYLRLLESVLFLTLPTLIFAAIHSEPIVVGLLGPQWAPVAPIFSLLAVGGLFSGIANSSGWLFVTQDRTRELRDFSIITAIFFSLAFLIGVKWGAVGVAAAYAIAASIQTPSIIWVATRRGAVSFRDLLETVAPFAMAGAGAAGVIYGLSGALPSNAVGLLAAYALAQIFFLIFLYLIPGGRSSLKAMWIHGRNLLGR